MEFYECVTYVIDKMRNFEREIIVQCNEGAEAVVLQALKTNLKLNFFVNEINVTNTAYPCAQKVMVGYRNTDFPQSQVIVVTKEEGVTQRLSQTINSFFDRLVVIVPKDRTFNPMKIFEIITEYLAGYAPYLAGNSAMEMSNGFVNMYDLRFTYRLSIDRLREMKEEVKTEVKRVASLLFKPYMPDYVKVFLAHNYLVVNTSYYRTEDADEFEMAYRQSAYGALIMNKCVCQGYADAFQQLMEEAKIESDIVCGQILGSTEYHAWNVISLNGGEDNFHIDITWDDVTQKPTYRYFGKSDLEMGGERVWNKGYTFKCKSSKDLLQMARHYVSVNRFKLIGDRIPLSVMDLPV